MADHRYHCHGCGNEFTLHANPDIDPAEYDPACPWCENTTGLPTWVPPYTSSVTDRMIAFHQHELARYLAQQMEAKK